MKGETLTKNGIIALASKIVTSFLLRVALREAFNKKPDFNFVATAISNRI
jgi:hypothetical protein